MDRFTNDDLLQTESSLSFEEREFNTPHNVFDDYMMKSSSLKHMNEDDDDIDTDDFMQLNTLGQSYLTLQDNNLTSLNKPSYLLNPAVKYSNEILNKINRVKFLLMAPTSPAVKISEPSLTYLNQEQNYELRLIYTELFNKHNSQSSYIDKDLKQKGKEFFGVKDVSDMKTDNQDKNNPVFLSLLRLCFWDHKLQEKERDKIKQVLFICLIRVSKTQFLSFFQRQKIQVGKRISEKDIGS
jgi:hypothetical protein